MPFLLKQNTFYGSLLTEIVVSSCGVMNFLTIKHYANIILYCSIIVALINNTCKNEISPLLGSFQNLIFLFTSWFS